MKFKLGCGRGCAIGCLAALLIPPGIVVLGWVATLVVPELTAVDGAAQPQHGDDNGSEIQPGAPAPTDR